MQHSPYTPGAMAIDVPGRDDQLSTINGTLARVATDAHFAGRIRVDVGPRGVGKTSLLRRAQRAADALGLATIFVTAGNGALTAVINDEISQLTRAWGIGDALSQRINEAKVAFGAPGFLGVELTAGRSVPPEATRAYRELITHTATAALEHGLKGLALFIDELQAADAASLRTIAYAWQELQAMPVPAATFAAGLSHTADVVTGTVTHAERFQYRPLPGLEPHQAREALTHPATTLGVTWRTPALQTVIERAQGYPYFIQLYGDEVWRAAGSPDRDSELTSEHVENAQQEIDLDLSELYRARWAKATPRERDLLLAIARADTTQVARKDIAAALGVETTAISVARQSLLDKGIIDAPVHGRLSFSVPGFARYVLNHSDG